jgi:aminopeptidase N
VWDNVGIILCSRTNTTQVFDAISYYKGNSVIRMLHSWLGAEDFRTALRAYMKRYKYGNTVSENLWAEMETASNKPVKQFMASWFLKMGFPCVEIAKHQVVPSDDGKTAQFQVTLQQNRFLSNGIDRKDDTCWHIPLSVWFCGAKPQTVLMTKREETFSFNLPAAAMALSADKKSFKWVKFNVDKISFIRVKYPKALFDKLLVGVSESTISSKTNSLQQAGTILSSIDLLDVQSDAFALARAGEVPADTLFELLQAYSRSTDYALWSTCISNLGDLYTLVKRTDDELCAQFAEFSRDLIGSALKRIGWEAAADDDAQTKLLRTLLVSTAVSFKVPCIIKRAHAEFFKAHAGLTTKAALVSSMSTSENKTSSSSAAGTSSSSSSSSLSPDLRGAVYKAAVLTGGQMGFDAVMDICAATSSSEEKNRCYGVLGATPDAALMKRYLQWAHNEDGVRTQDVAYVFASIANNRGGLDYMWQFIQDNWTDIKTKYAGGFILGRVIGVVRHFASDAKADEIEAFFAKRDAPSAKRTIAQTVERVRSNAAYFKKSMGPIKTWLAKFSATKAAEKKQAAAAAAAAATAAAAK